ncbi:MAG: hypothetical protein J6B39_03815 [Lachnospiraceae bacterium]|nr:hypothetical protein [Lachnospiraceae bacterium]
MSINGIMNQVVSPEATYATKDTVKNVVADKKNNDDVAAVYEASNEKVTKKTYTQDTATIAKMKAEADEKTAQFRELVEKLLSQQITTADIADSIWQKFANGEFEVDQATIDQAKEDVSEDGYWGVEQTSERIFEFAKALSGGDPDKMDDMLDAFKEGFNQATAAWGKELPEISSKTYDAVMKKFEDYKKGETEAADAEAGTVKALEF